MLRNCLAAGWLSKADWQSVQDSSSMLHADRKGGDWRIVMIAKVLQVLSEKKTRVLLAAAKTNVSVTPDRAGPLPDQKAEREENKSS
jgi:hypothetical protein